MNDALDRGRSGGRVIIVLRVNRTVGVRWIYFGPRRWQLVRGNRHQFVVVVDVDNGGLAGDVGGHRGNLHKGVAIVINRSRVAQFRQIVIRNGS